MDLRTRIAEVIAAAQAAFDKGDPYNGPEDSAILADAVIRELAAPCRSGCMWQIPEHIEDMTPQQRSALGLSVTDA